MKKVLLFLILLCLAFLYSGDSTSKQVIINSSMNRSFQIYRDENGVAHIFAKTKQDILFGLGYSQGEDRLWTLMIKKFLVEGRMSQLFGREGLPSDYFTRNFKFYHVGKMNAKLLSQQIRNRAQAYCDGINYYARTAKFLSPEFYVFWVEWEDWTIQNTLGLLAFLSFSLEFDWMYEIARQRLLETVGFDLAFQIINFGSKTLFRQVTIMKQDELKAQNLWEQYNASKQYDILKQNWANKKTALGSIHLPTYEFQGSGSNGWVIGGQHTQNGRPLLANDPHLGTLAPPVFYVSELGLVDEENKIITQTFGASISGVPSISIGVNQHFAWGSTASYVDNKDLFYQTVRIKDQAFQYLHQGEWKDFGVRNEVFKIRWEGQIQRTMYENHRGPVVEDIFDQIYYKYSYPMPNKYRINHTLTIQASIFKPDYTSLDGLTSIAFSNTYEQFKNSSSSINAPNIDSVFITQKGRYGYAAMGRIPFRDVNQMSGFIKQGTTSNYQMKGFLPNELKPQIQNPVKGYVAMCNNKFAPDQYKYRSSLHEITTGRSYRLEKIITDHIGQGHKFGFQDMKHMQLDLKDQFLAEVFPLILIRLQSLRYIWSNPKTEQYFKLFKNWDYLMDKDSPQATLYHVWERLVQSSFLVETELNEQQREAIINHAFFQNYQFRLFEKIYASELGEQERIVCSNQQTRNFTNIHACEASIALAFKKITFEVERIYQTEDISKYKWGQIHLATFKSIPFSDVPGLKHIWQRQTPIGGNSRSLNVGILTHQSKGDNKYRSVAGPVFRFITDLNTTIWSLDIGNSGNILSPFYDNFLGKDIYIIYTPQNPYIKLPQNWKLSAKGL